MLFFKKLFKKFKKATASIKQVNLQTDEIKDWFIKNTTKELDQLNEDILAQLEIIKSESKNILEYVEEFKNKDLENQKIPQKAILTIKGNKESYLQKTQRLLKELNVESIKTHDLKNVDEYIKSSKQKIDEYSKNTQRAFLILQEFYKHDTDKIISHIKQIDTAVNVLDSSLNSEKIKNINETKQEIDEYLQNLSHSKEYSKKLEELKKQKEEIEEQKNKQTFKKQEIMNSQNYQDYKEIYEEKEKIQKNQKELEQKLKETFLQIDTALRKYERNAPESNLIKKYLESPLDSLKGDLTFKILEVIDKLKHGIEIGDIELKDKKKENTINTLNIMDKAFFEGINNEQFMIDERRKSVEEKIAKNKTMSDLSEIDYHLDHLATKEKRLVDEMQKIDVLTKRFDPAKEIKKLEKAMLESTSIIAKISQEQDEEDESESQGIKEENKSYEYDI